MRQLTKLNAKPTPSGYVLSADRVSKSYRLGEVDVPALKQVSLFVPKGDFFAIAGSSGSGKTTLLNLFACLDRPSSGTIHIEGRKTSALSGREAALLRAERIGYVFQNFNLIPVLTAYENVEYPLLILKVPRDERRIRVAEALRLVGLEHHLTRRPDQLSGGQRQRVAIARAMVKNPALVLADEPTANLDKATAKSLLELMRALNRERQTTFIFTSHDPLILAEANRVLTLSDGEVTVGGDIGNEEFSRAV